MIMIDLIAFIFSCLTGIGMGDETTGAKRKDISPLAKMNVKKLKVDMMGVRKGATPTFKVNVKNSTEPGGKWATIGNVQIRDPRMYGQLSQASINILVELSLMEE